MDAANYNGAPGACEYDDMCVDDHCAICGEFEAECICYDETDEADEQLAIEMEERD